MLEFKKIAQIVAVFAFGIAPVEGRGEAPIITEFTPTAAPTGTIVTIIGKGLMSASSLTFNGVETTVFLIKVGNSDFIGTLVPEGATTGPIVVTNPWGVADSLESFTVVPRATVASFSPNEGRVGTEVSVVGSGFLNAIGVLFGPTWDTAKEASFTVTDDSHLVATVPGGATEGPIAIKTPGGYAASEEQIPGAFAASEEKFTVLPGPAPMITGFEPAGAGWGVQVTLHGTSFTLASDVQFNGTKAWEVEIDSDEQISVNVPWDAESGPITVTTPSGTGVSESFTVIAEPTIEAFSPTEGVVGTQVTITGSGFTGATAVQIGSWKAPFHVEDDAHLTATVTGGAAGMYVAVEAPGGWAYASGNFDVLAEEAPTIAGFSPDVGAAGATVITISGSGFHGLVGATVNGVNITRAAIPSDTELLILVPAGAESGPISVTNSMGTAISSEFLQVSRPPVISSFSPKEGPPGTVVTIEGSFFTGADEVALGGGRQAEALFTVIDDSSLTAVVPESLAPGALSFRIHVPGGYGVSFDRFAVLAASPGPQSDAPPPAQSGCGSASGGATPWGWSALVGLGLGWILARRRRWSKDRSAMLAGAALALLAWSCGEDSAPSQPDDLCATVDCGSHGQCSDGACACSDGYSGDRCQTPFSCVPADIAADAFDACDCGATPDDPVLIADHCYEGAFDYPVFRRACMVDSSCRAYPMILGRNPPHSIDSSLRDDVAIRFEFFKALPDDANLTLNDPNASFPLVSPLHFCAASNWEWQEDPPSMSFDNTQQAEVRVAPDRRSITIVPEQRCFQGRWTLSGGINLTDVWAFDCPPGPGGVSSGWSYGATFELE